MSATGRTKSDGTTTERQANDNYQTPLWCVHLLLPWIRITPRTTFLEPCRGVGRIYDNVPAEEKLWCEITEGVDYLTAPPIPADLCVTNPPFSLALEFVRKSLAECETVIYLQRLNWLGSKERVDFWNANRPTHLFVITPRPSFTGGGSDASEYAWICWDRGNRIKTREFITVLRKPGR